MPNARAKTINLLLYEGSLKGVISIADSSWNSGELYSAPRESVEDLLSTEACNKFGVYCLLSEEMVYVGQSSDLAKRIKQHIIGKDWWERVVVLTTSDDSLNRSDIDYLEHVLISKAEKGKRLDCDNKTKGNSPKIDKFRQVLLDQYLGEALFLLELIGITVFKPLRQGKVSKTEALIDSVKSNTEHGREIRAKKEAKEYLQSVGMNLTGNVTYAKDSDRNYYWANPNVDLLLDEWQIILNNTNEKQLTVLRIPSNLFSIGTGDNQLCVRKDVPYRIDLRIDKNTLIDKASGMDFKPFVVKKLEY